MGTDTSGKGADPREMISHAALLYESAADAFALVIDEARAGEPAAARAAASHAREFRQALLAVLNERATIEKFRTDVEGLGPGSLDFDGARAEIGRRLACLRNAGDGG
ncbi:hypothetical protein [Solirhodobacter olei]|uniref:hypothetical protein n=1 Tax=Solirhodobacter olei TaxID=2493082 RepID=UPI000FDC3641|nr:hypothetical protein [Solirhodobacter olei]